MRLMACARVRPCVPVCAGRRLPQSPAYNTLKNRLSAVPEIGLLRLQLARGGGGGAHGRGEQHGGGGIDFGGLLKVYEETQSKHARLQQKQRRGHGRGSMAAAVVT
jgi:hypothetical protein